MKSRESGGAPTEGGVFARGLWRRGKARLRRRGRRGRFPRAFCAAGSRLAQGGRPRQSPGLAEGRRRAGLTQCGPFRLPWSSHGDDPTFGPNFCTEICFFYQLVRFVSKVSQTVWKLGRLSDRSNFPGILARFERSEAGQMQKLALSEPVFGRNVSSRTVWSIFDRGDDRVRLEGELPARFREGLIM